MTDDAGPLRDVPAWPWGIDIIVGVEGYLDASGRQSLQILKRVRLRLIAYRQFLKRQIHFWIVPGFQCQLSHVGLESLRRDSDFIIARKQRNGAKLAGIG